MCTPVGHDNKQMGSVSTVIQISGSQMAQKWKRRVMTLLTGCSCKPSSVVWRDWRQNTVRKPELGVLSFIMATKGLHYLRNEKEPRASSSFHTICWINTLLVNMLWTFIFHDIILHSRSNWVCSAVQWLRVLKPSVPVRAGPPEVPWSSSSGRTFLRGYRWCLAACSCGVR